MLDFELLRQFKHLGSARQRELANSIGTTVSNICDSLVEIDGQTSGSFAPSVADRGWWEHGH